MYTNYIKYLGTYLIIKHTFSKILKCYIHTTLFVQRPFLDVEKSRLDILFHLK